MDNLIVACAVCLSTNKLSQIPSHWLDTLSLTVKSGHACWLCYAVLRRAASTVRRAHHSQCILDNLRITGQLNQENIEKASQTSNPYRLTIHHLRPNHYDYEYKGDDETDKCIKEEPKDEIDHVAAWSDESYTETLAKLNRNEIRKNSSDTWSEEYDEPIELFNSTESRSVPNKKANRKKNNIHSNSINKIIDETSRTDTWTDDSDSVPIEELKRKAKNRTDKLKRSKFTAKERGKRKRLTKENEQREAKKDYSKIELKKLKLKQWMSERKDRKGISDFKKQRLEMDALLEKCFKITKLSLEEMKQEVLKGKESSNYRMSYFKCDICFRGFSESSVYERHKLRHTPLMGGHECEVCHWFVGALARHRNDRHLYRFRCRKCDVVIQNRTAAVNHARHHEGKMFVCDKCGKVFLHRSTHLSHLRIKHPSDHICTLCGFSFINERGVLVHKTRVHPAADTNIPDDSPACAECDIKFKTSEALTIHEKVSPRHGEVRARNDPCRFPGADGSRTRNSNVPRKRRPREDDQTVHICEHCGKPIMGVQNYRSHVTSQHPNKDAAAAAAAAAPPQRLCTICGKTYKTLTLLRIHIDSHNPRYECDICHHKFTVARSLAVHMNLHTKDHEYSCHVCGKVFNNSGNRRRHLLTVHSEARIQCSFCEKCFKSKQELGAHVKHVHLKVPYPKRSRRRERVKRPGSGDRDPE